MSDQVLVTRSYLEDTGDAIREKLETDLAYTPAEFGSAIRSIEGGASEDAVKYTEQSPTTEQQAQARANIGAAKNAAFTGGQTVTVQRNGARIVVNDTIDAKLPAFTLNGKSTQAGTPAPEDPADIATAGSAGSVEVVSVDAGTDKHNPATDTAQTINDNGVITDSAGHILTDYIPITGNYLYIKWDNVVGTGCYLRRAYYTANKTFIRRDYRPVLEQGRGGDFWTPINTARYVRLCWDNSNYNSLSGLKVHDGYSIDIPTPNGLPGIPVSNGGNYTDAGGQQWICDTIDKAAGVYTQRVGKVVWDGSSDESWTPQPAWTLPGFTIRIEDSAIQTDVTKPPNVLCDRLPAIPNSASYSQYDALVSMTNNAPVYQVAIDGYSSETAFRGFLAENHITMLYPLATPVTTPLTAAQLAALDALRSHEGQTAIYTTDAVQPEVAASLLTGVSGGAGIVPAPDSGSQYLGGDGAWHTPDDTPTANSTALINSGAVYAALQDFLYSHDGTNLDY